MYELGGLQRVLRDDPTIQATVVAPSIAAWKDAHAQVLNGLEGVLTVTFGAKRGFEGGAAVTSGFTSSSITSPMPVPCNPETGHGVPMPRV